MNNILLITLGILIPFIATIIGSSLIFFFKNQTSLKFNSIVNGFSAGIMISASFFGLLLPAIESSSHLNGFSFIPAVIGTIIGCLFILIIDIIIKLTNKNKNSPNANLKLSRFIVAFTIHNIPEGLAVGFSIGNALLIGSNSAMLISLILAIGIAIQNIPEGIAVSLPVYNSSKNKTKAFLCGVINAVAEMLACILGILLASSLETILPWLLAFSAGAMIFVSVNDLIPDSKETSTSTLGTWCFIIGFVLMMILDLCLG